MKSFPLLTGTSIDDAWLGLLCSCHDYGDVVGPRNLTTKELLGTATFIDMRYPTLGNYQRKLHYRHLANEAHWILSGSNKLSEITRFAPSYVKYSDDGIILQGAYGPPVTEQMRYVVDTLSRDPYSRQAVISIWRPNPRESRDIPCTLSLQFLLRHGKLHCMATMRSSDVWLGMPYDVFCFTMITASLALRIYPNPDLGILCLRAGSTHLYESNEKAAVECVKLGKNAREFPPMSLEGLTNPESLMNALIAVMESRVTSSPHLNSISAAIFDELKK